MGMIYFDPISTTKDPGGTMGFAKILQGKFDTRQEGQPLRPGNYEIRILGYDGIPAEEAPYGKALFTEVKLTKSFTASDTTFDHDIPK